MFEESSKVSGILPSISSSKKAEDQKYQCESIIKKYENWVNFYKFNIQQGRSIALYTHGLIYGQLLDSKMGTDSVPAWYSNIDTSIGNTNYLAPIRDAIMEMISQYGLGFSIEPNVDANFKDVQILQNLYNKIMYAEELSANWKRGIEYMLDYGYYGLLVTKRREDGSNFPKIESLHPLNCFWDISAKATFKQDGHYCGYIESYNLEHLTFVYQNNKKLKELWRDCKKAQTGSGEYMTFEVNVTHYFEKQFKKVKYVRYDMSSIAEKYSANNELMNVLNKLTAGDFEDVLIDQMQGMIDGVAQNISQSMQGLMQEKQQAEQQMQQQQMQQQQMQASSTESSTESNGQPQTESSTESGDPMQEQVEMQPQQNSQQLAADQQMQQQQQQMMASFDQAFAILEQKFQELTQFNQDIYNVISFDPIIENVSQNVIRAITFLPDQHGEYIILRDEEYFTNELPLIFTGKTVHTPYKNAIDIKKSPQISDVSTINCYEAVDSYFAKILPTIKTLNRMDTAILNSLKEMPIAIFAKSGINVDPTMLDKVASSLIDIPQAQIFTVECGPDPIQNALTVVPLAPSKQELLALQQVYFQHLSLLTRIKPQDNATPQDPRSNQGQIMRIEQAKQAIEIIHSPILDATERAASILKNALPKLKLIANLNQKIYEGDKYNISIKVTGGSLTQDDYEAQQIREMMNNPIVQEIKGLTLYLGAELIQRLKSPNAEVVANLIKIAAPEILEKFAKGDATKDEVRQYFTKTNEQIAEQSKSSNDTIIAQATDKSATAELIKAEAYKESRGEELQIKTLHAQIEMQELKIKQQEADTKTAKVKDEIKNNGKQTLAMLLKDSKNSSTEGVKTNAKSKSE